MPPPRRSRWRRRRGDPLELAYDRLVWATGSRLSVPAVPGFAEYGFNVDTLESAQRLDAHIKALAAKPSTPARNTAVVVGAGADRAGECGGDAAAAAGCAGQRRERARGDRR